MSSKYPPLIQNAAFHAKRVEDLFQQGLELHQKGQLEQAKGFYGQVLTLQPKHFVALHLSGVIASQTKNHALAAELMGKAIAIKPDYAEAFSNRGNALKELDRLDEALASYDKAIAIKPDYAKAFNNRGVTLQALHRLEEALTSYDQAITIQPDYAEAFNNRGNALRGLKRLNEALISYDNAIAIHPHYSDAFNNRGVALQELKLFDGAIASYLNAISNKPDYAEAFNNLGNALKDLRRLGEALACYDRAIAIHPDYAEAFHNRGNVLLDLKRLEEALGSYEKAFALKPNLDFLFGLKINAQLKLCDWRSLSLQLNELDSLLLTDQKVINPFLLLGIIDNPGIQFKAAKTFSKTEYPARHFSLNFSNRIIDKKIRVAYYSADFHNHATSYLMAELFEAHDKERFEIFGFSFGPHSEDEMRQRVSRCFHQFFDIGGKSDREVSDLSRDLEIDIAIDLKGFTQDSRTGIFAMGCAPIQVNYLGYPGTMGAPYMDYIIADRTLIPNESQQYYTEKIVYLPHSYQVNDSRRRISDRIFSRHEVGLPEDGFVFCCFNNSYKILPETFDIWMRLLKCVEGSVLWLLEDNPNASIHLRDEAESRGIDASRLVFAKRMPLEDHLARHRLADLFIDTWPYNAHTTASDALWAGLPLLTFSGKSFGARVAASLLNAMNLPELITETAEQYEAKAIELASNTMLLAGIKDKLVRNLPISPLFDAQQFSRHIEVAFTEMHTRYQAGLEKDHIYID